MQNLDREIKNASKTSIQIIQNIKEQSLVISEQGKIGLRSINAEVKHQLDLFQKIGASEEFSPLIKPVRGDIIDVDNLRVSVIRALEIMTSRLDNIMHHITKEIIESHKYSTVRIHV